jgi:hypothetical protein
MANVKQTKKAVVSDVALADFNVSLKEAGVSRELRRGIFKSMKTMESVGSAAMKQNQELSKNPLKLWFEILTNIPASVRKIIFEITRTKNGFKAKIIQIGEGTRLETINENLLDDGTVETGEFKDKNESQNSSIYGTGIYTQSLYTSSLTYKVKTIDMSEWEVWDVKTGESYTEIDNTYNSGVIIEMEIPYSQRMGSYTKYIEDLRNIFGHYDNRNISAGREYIFNVSGFDTQTQNAELSKPIQPIAITWFSKKGRQITFAEFNHLTLHSKTYKELVIKVPLENDDKLITLSNFKLGKRDGNLMGMEGDRPYLIVYYKGSNQIAFVLPLRGHSGSTSLNNVTLECDIDKVELRPFFVTVDKFAGVNPLLEKILSDTLKPYLLDTYPDNKLLERAIQLWLYDVIVNDSMGSGVCDLLRNKWGLEFLNDMSEEKRKKVVYMEWDSDNKRHDFKIYKTDKNAKITTDTKCIVIECKRDDFNDSARLQAMGYVVATKNVVKIIGVSRNIKPKNINNWNAFITNVKGSGQLSFELEDSLIDVAIDGFDKNYDEYTSKALEELK